MQDDPGVWQSPPDEREELRNVHDMDNVAVLQREIRDDPADELPIPQSGVENRLRCVPPSNKLESLHDSAVMQQEPAVECYWQAPILDAVEFLDVRLTFTTGAICYNIVESGEPPRNFVHDQVDGNTPAS
jgi:hypothetical protein